MIGKSISHYKILEKIGEGGMGVVYKVQDTKLERLVALKFLPPHISINKEEKKRFIHEAKAAAALDHTNICAVYEIDETEDGQMFIAMACYEGETLKEKVEKGPLKLDEAINIAIQVAHGLQRAHESHIVHRDIKSANIIVTKRNEVKILDFGLAKLRGVTKLTKEGTTLGTVAYMSPEQASGDKVDHRSDIWSLGVLLYEMVTGQLPFKGEYEQAIMYSIMNEEPEPVTGLRAAVPMDLERIINKVLAKNPEYRYQTTADLLVDLRKVKRDTKPDIKRPPTLMKTSVPSDWKKLFIPAVIVIIFVLIGLLVWSPRTKKEMAPIPSDKPSLAVMYFKNLTGDKNFDHWKTGISYSIITDLTQSKYLNVLRTDRLFSILRKLNLLDSTEYTTEDLQAVAAQGDVTHIIMGRFLKGGDTFRIEYTLQDINREKSIGSGRVEGQGEERIFTMVDKLTRLIKADFKFSEKTIASDIDKEVKKITTSSPEAFKYYVEGRKYHLQGKYRKSIKLMEKATAIDPEFAMAYRDISHSHWSLYNTAKSNLYMKKAFELADRLPARELYLIQGNFYSRSEKTYDRAIHAYNKLLELYPEELDTLEHLGLVYYRMQEYDKAIEIYKKRLQQKIKRSSPYMNLASLYWKKGFFDKSREVIENYIKNFKDKAIIRWYLALTYFHQGKFDLALAEADKSLSLDPTFSRSIWTKGNIYLYKGDLNQAEKEYQKLLKHKEQSAQYIGIGQLADLILFHGQFKESINYTRAQIELADKMGDIGKLRSRYFTLSNLYRKLGNYQDALKECGKYWSGAVEEDSIDNQRWALYEKGLVYLAMKSIGKAQQAARELKEMIDKGIIRNHIRMYYHLMGKIELEKGEYINAQKFFNKMVPFLHAISPWHITLADSLGMAYYKAGNLEKAQEEYEKVTSSAPGRRFNGDVFAKVFYQLGKIYEQKGFKGKAIDSYSKFITLWKDCDPQFQPLVEDARKRVKELEANK